MLTIDDELIDEYDSQEQNTQPSKIGYNDILTDRGTFTGITSAFPITYNAILKKFIPGNNLENKNNAFLGWFIEYNDMENTIDVLYRGFLMNEITTLPITLQSRYIQSYISDKFKEACKTIIANMPRIKKLKRLNLKMITYEHAKFIYRYIDKMISYYEDMYGYEKAMMIKAQITTSPFYVNDNGIIKIFNIQTNELTIPELESQAYFLAYFTFKNK